MDNARRRSKQLMAARFRRRRELHKQAEAQTQMVEAKDVISLINKLESVELKLMLALCRFGGLRQDEASSITWESIHFEDKLMFIHPSKNRKRLRLCPLFADLASLIAPYAATGRVQRLWEPGSPAPRILLKKECERLGFKLWPRTFYSLRMSRIDELLAAFPCDDVMIWLDIPDASKVRLHYLNKHCAHYLDKSFSESIVKAGSYSVTESM